MTRAVAFRRLMFPLALLAWPVLAWSGLEVTVSDAAGRALAGVAVFVESPAARAAMQPIAQVEVVQRERQFIPRVTVVPVGTAVSFPNVDTVRHHVYSFSPAKRFEIKLYVGTPAQPVVFDQPGVVAMGCNIHDTMAAWVLAVETPWYGFTDAQGRISLPAVPAGRHRVRAWHPGLPAGVPPVEQPVQVPAQGRLPVQLRLAGVTS